MKSKSPLKLSHDKAYKKPGLDPQEMAALFSTEIRIAIENLSANVLTQHGLQVFSIRTKINSTGFTETESSNLHPSSGKTLFEVTYLLDDGSWSVKIEPNEGMIQNVP